MMNTWFPIYIFCGLSTLIPLCVMAYVEDKEVSLLDMLATVFLWPIILIVLVIVWIRMIIVARSKKQLVRVIHSAIEEAITESIGEMKSKSNKAGTSDLPKRKRGRPRKQVSVDKDV
jgi:hypothetical protein